MPTHEPRWWYAGKWPAIATALRPAAWLYGLATVTRFTRATTHHARIPVICIGNLVTGGTGKTPLALHICSWLIERGAQPVFLSRGYGGRMRGPHRVDPHTDTSADVGDEPLLLAARAPVVVSRDRAAGARLIETMAATHILMDDGLQNPSLHKDLSLALVDGERWIGNGLMIPAGPLRAPLAFQSGLVDALVIGQAEGASVAATSDMPAEVRDAFPMQKLRVQRQVDGDAAWLRQRPWIAFAGIGRPDSFFATLEHHGALLAVRKPFADHHPYSHEDARALLALADAHDAGIVTTQKDWVRLTQGAGDIGHLRARARVLGLRLALTPDDAAALDRMLTGVLGGRLR